MKGRRGRERKKETNERDTMGWCIGKEEESLQEDTKVISLLPGRKRFEPFLDFICLL